MFKRVQLGILQIGLVLLHGGAVLSLPRKEHPYASEAMADGF